MASRSCIDIGASIAASFTDQIGSLSTRGKPIDFSAEQLQMLQEMFEASFGGIAKVVAEHIGALETRLLKAEGDPYLDQRVAATSGVEEVCHAGSSKTRSRRLRRLRTKNKYTYSKAHLLSLLPAASLQDGRFATGIVCSKANITLERTRREVLCLEHMIPDDLSNNCEKRKASDEIVRHLQPSSSDSQWCDVITRLAAIESIAVNTSTCHDICGGVIDGKLRCVLELMKEFNEESRSAVRSHSLDLAEHVEGVMKDVRQDFSEQINMLRSRLAPMDEELFTSDVDYWQHLFKSLENPDFPCSFQHVLEGCEP